MTDNRCSLSATSGELAISDDNALDHGWNDIVEQLLNEVCESDLPENVVKATEYLLAGWSTRQVADELNITSRTVKDWMRKYATMAMAVRNGRKLLSKWRLSRLEQQFVQAVEKSREILSLELEDDTVNSKLVATIAQHARFIISLFAGQKIDVNINFPGADQTLKAKADALDYLAEALARQREGEEPIEASYEVVEVNSREHQPLLDEEGHPFFGKIGQIDTTDEGTLCHICGQRHKQFGLHISSIHKIKYQEYELVYMLPLGTIRDLATPKLASGEK